MCYSVLCCCYVAAVCVFVRYASGYCTVSTFSAVAVAFFGAFDVFFYPMNSHCFIVLWCGFAMSLLFVLFFGLLWLLNCLC